MRNFGPTKTLATAFAPKQWLYRKEVTSTQSLKLHCPSQCRYPTYQCVAANHPVSWGLVKGPEWKDAEFRAYQSPCYHICTKAMVVSKGSYGHGEFQNENMPKFGHTNPHGTACAPKQWLYQKEATGMESSQMYCPRWCRYCTYQCVAANYLVSWGVV